MGAVIGQSHHRKEAWDKVTGQALYTDDLPTQGTLCARIVTSPYGHARIRRMDVTDALALQGVHAVLTGADCQGLGGTLIKDHPVLARDVVRYAGEPVAMVVARDASIADQALSRIVAEYEPLPCVFRASDALAENAPILHEGLGSYAVTVDDVIPMPGTNISAHYPVRKGDMNEGWAQSEIIIERHFDLPPTAHMAMEIRTGRATIKRDGTVDIVSSTQAPFEVVKQNGALFDVPSGNIRSTAPFLGGAYGGKVSVVTEALAQLASIHVNGQPVRVLLTREQDMISLPCRMGLEATIKIGATKDGRIMAMELYCLLDHGAYSDIGPYMAKVAAADCTGPYRVAHVCCDVFAVYTNHTFATSYRGFAHESMTLCVERSMDALADELCMDPLVLRRINAIAPLDDSPTQVTCTSSNLGDMKACIEGIQTLAQWNPTPLRIDANHVRAQGMACFWKASTPPTDAVSGALITCNADGTLNLHTGVVEMGSGSKSMLCEMLAERMGMSVEQIHVVMDVDTRVAPKHYKSVASLSSYIAGRAVMRAADDVLAQLREIGAQALHCFPEDIDIREGKVIMRSDPSVYIPFADIVYGYKAEDGTSIGNPVIGRGGSMFRGLSSLNPTTGAGKPGPAWTVGAQVVEVDLDLRDGSYRIVRASTVMDVGCAANPDMMRQLVRGGMSMGLSMASREAFHYNSDGKPMATSLRSYKVMHIGEEPEYRIAFVETPQMDSPYGVRSISEHGIIGMPAALANALTRACGYEVNALPATPERIYDLLKEIKA